MEQFTAEALLHLSDAFEPVRDPQRALAMAAYMRGQFAFLGIPSPLRRRLQREALTGIGQPGEAALAEIGRALWARPEREYQYAAADILAQHVGHCGPQFIQTTRQLITTRSWWDTVDALAVHVAGPLVAAHPELTLEMDRWLESEDFWLARAAILHQLTFKHATDAERLFRYCLYRGSDSEFFLRKAIGWALREYSKTDATAVRSFVATYADQLSPLSKREALLWLNGGRARRTAAHHA